MNFHIVELFWIIFTLSCTSVNSTTLTTGTGISFNASTKTAFSSAVSNPPLELDGNIGTLENGTPPPATLTALAIGTQ